MKPCRTCGASDRAPSGPCRPCGRESARRWRLAHLETVRAIQRAHYARRPAKKKARAKAKWLADPVGQVARLKRWRQAARARRLVLAGVL